MAIGMQNGENPMEYKKRLAREVIAIYYDKAAAEQAQQNWEKTFSEGGIPDDVPEVGAPAGTALIDILLAHGVVESKSEFRRLVEEGALKVLKDAGEEKISDVKQVISEPIILKIGKKKFLRITPQ
jgi:tyrosyl-tRNA synthetase